MKKSIDKYDNLLADFNLYLCEHFGHRESAHFNRISNGEIICASNRDYDLYIRFWEHGGKVRRLPDKIVIIVQATFYKCGQQEGFDNLMRFIKAYAPLYGFEYISIEGCVDRLDKTRYGFPKQDCYSAPYGPMRIEDIIIPYLPITRCSQR